MADEQIIAIPMVSSGGGGVPQQQKNLSADFMDKIKPEAAVEVIRHRLLGEEFVGGGKWEPVEALSNRKLSEIGSWEVSNLMLGTSTINMSISKLNSDQIKNRLLNIAKTSQRLLVRNWKTYGLNNTATQWYIHEIVFSNTLGVLNQAGDASIQELLKGTVQENRSVTTEVKRESRLKKLLGLGA